jgi:hypothetical protein
MPTKNIVEGSGTAVRTATLALAVAESHGDAEAFKVSNEALTAAGEPVHHESIDRALVACVSTMSFFLLL